MNRILEVNVKKAVAFVEPGNTFFPASRVSGLTISIFEIEDGSVLSMLSSEASTTPHMEVSIVVKTQS